jgi:hypothetical protein
LLTPPGAGISPGTVNAYANYLDARVRAYRELGHDLYYIQNESNRRSTGLGANCKLGLV